MWIDNPPYMLHVLNALSKTTHIAVSVLTIKEYANVDLWSFLIDQCLDCPMQWNLTFSPVSSLPYWAHLSDWWNWFKNSWITQNDSTGIWKLRVPWSSIVKMDDACQKRVYIVRTCMYWYKFYDHLWWKWSYSVFLTCIWSWF